jgi:hypothetical protein
MVSLEIMNRGFIVLTSAALIICRGLSTHYADGGEDLLIKKVENLTN